MAACPSDVDQNGSVGFADVLSLRDWGCARVPTVMWTTAAPWTFDLLAVIANWGDC